MGFDYWQKFEDGRFYHIYNRGINHENIFKTDENMRFFLRRWNDIMGPYLDVAAFCLMPNHFHFLARVKPLTEEIQGIINQEGTARANKLREGQISYNDFLEDQFKRLFQSYALAFNKQQGRTGSLLQKRFKRVRISHESKFWHILVYIHHNPIHHRFRTRYEDWHFSSYNSYFSENQAGIIKEEILARFDPKYIVSFASHTDQHIHRETAIQHFRRYHEEFSQNYTDVGDYYLDDVY
ncbi:MAG: hypothetical protein SF053_11400 [Bacteroidia bacterium]|nr:hypothetical protein [Bacteroidia bacterium]